MNIKFLKLVTGEDVLAEMSFENERYVLKHPVRILPTREGIGMGPLNPFSKGEKIEIPKEHVIYKDDPDDEIKNAYNAQFGSGIVIPPSGLNIVD